MRLVRKRDEPVSPIERNRNVTFGIDDYSRRGNQLTGSTSATEGIDEQELAKSTATELPIDSKAPEKCCWYQRIAGKSLLRLRGQLVESDAGGSKRVIPGDGRGRIGRQCHVGDGRVAVHLLSGLNPKEASEGLQSAVEGIATVTPREHFNGECDGGRVGHAVYRVRDPEARFLVDGALEGEAD